MGGIIIIISTLISTLIFDHFNIYILILIITTLWMGLTGFIDDYIKIFLKKKQGITKMTKLISQLILGILIGSILYKIKLINNPNYYYYINNNTLFDIILFILITSSLIILISNAANITDGIDGLTASISTIIIFAIILLLVKLNINELLIYL